MLDYLGCRMHVGSQEGKGRFDSAPCPNCGRVSTEQSPGRWGSLAAGKTAHILRGNRGESERQARRAIDRANRGTRPTELQGTVSRYGRGYRRGRERAYPSRVGSRASALRRREGMTRSEELIARVREELGPTIPSSVLELIAEYEIAILQALTLERTIHRLTK